MSIILLWYKILSSIEFSAAGLDLGYEIEILNFFGLQSIIIQIIKKFQWEEG